MPRWSARVPIGDPSDPRGFEVLARRYLEHLGVKNYSPRTISTAESQLRIFARWCEERSILQPAEVSRSLVERYQRWLYHYRREDGRPLAFGTQLGRLSRVKGFFRFLARERYLLYNPASEIELPKEKPRLPLHALSQEEAESILAVPDVSKALGLRDRAILETLYATGMRRSEVAGLDLYDIDRERGWATIRHGKGDKDRVVPLGERALAWLERYLEDARPKLVLRADELAIFIGSSGLRFTPDGLGNRVTQLVRKSGVRQHAGSCHLFRHTAATLMLEGGADIRYIQEMLGHAKLETTQVYTKVSIAKLAEIHAATHPGARLRKHKAENQEDA